MSTDNRMTDMIPVWYRPPRGEEFLASLVLEPREGDILIDQLNFPSLAEMIDDIGRPAFYLFDLPSEARAAAVALNGNDTNGAAAKDIVAGSTLHGEGLLMVVSDDEVRADYPEFDIHDHRTPTGYKCEVTGSWYHYGTEVALMLAAPKADRVDLASVIAGKIAELANPCVLRAIQNELEKLPGANAGAPALSVEDLEQDIEIDESLDPAVLQRAIVRFAARQDCSGPADSLVRHLVEEFPGQARLKVYDPDGPDF